MEKSIIRRFFLSEKAILILVLLNTLSIFIGGYFPGAYGFVIADCIFTLLFIFEAVVKIKTLGLKDYWADGVFQDVRPEMCGLEWGRLYETYHNTPYDPEAVNGRVRALYGDEFVSDRRGIFEYVLGGEQNKSLLNIRVFDDRTKKKVYARQTAMAEAEHISNCPYCAQMEGANRTRIYKLSEMDADHVTAWSNGGSTDESNCQMLCKTHNRSKGNR